ncbi:hypothetical protein FACS1894125_6100 [Actinomycetota bacterium]|nr:hypothetical protein FACS1894125_6100 [Actinomycetota bacterium]
MKNSEKLKVFTRSAELVELVFAITRTSPKSTRYDFVSTMHKLALDVLQELFKGNDIFWEPGDGQIRERELRAQHFRNARANTKILIVVSRIAKGVDPKVINSQDYMRISKLSIEVQKLLGGMLAADIRRDKSKNGN